MNTCKVCDSLISPTSTYCREHFQSGQRNPMYGKHPWNYIEYKEKYYCIDCGKVVSTKSTKRCRSCARTYQYKTRPETMGMLGRTKEQSSNWKGGKPTCVACGKQLSAYHVKRCKKCEDKLRWVNGTSGIQQYIKKHGVPTWKRLKYKGVWMRSTWETTFAELLDIHKLKWLYESETFTLKDTTYTPDFYLPSINLHIEIKGFFRDDSKAKIREFRQTFNKVNFMLIDKPIYLKTVKHGIMPKLIADTHNKEY